MAQERTVCILSDKAIHAVRCARRAGKWIDVQSAQVPFSVPCSLFVDHDPHVLAEAIEESIKKTEAPGRTLRLVVPLTWCFTEVLEIGPALGPHAWPFALEPFLPMPLEELTCAFTKQPGNHILGAAIPTSPLKNLVSALEARGLEVEDLVLDALAALEAAKCQNTSAHVLLLDRHWTRIGTCDTTNPTRLFAIGCASSDRRVEDLIEAIKLRVPEGGAWMAVELGPPNTSNLQERLAPIGQVTPLSNADALAAMARVVASTESSLDFVAGVLARPIRHAVLRRSLRQCACLLLALLCLWLFGFDLRRRAMNQQIEDLAVQQRAVYEEVLPGQPYPPGAAARLASERIRLQGITQKHPSSTQNNARGLGPPLEFLREWVARLPEDVRLEVANIRVDDRQCLLRGRTVEHRDAERMVEAMNALPGVSAQAPRTHRLDEGGVEFSIVATGAIHAENNPGP